MPLPKTELLLAVALTSLGTVTLVLGLLVVGRLYRQKRSRLRNLDYAPPIDGEVPVDDPAAVQKKRGLASLEKQYSTGRRALIPIVVVLTAAAAAIPLLDQVPAAMLSFLIGAVTVLVGIAARPYLENFIAGLVISTSRAFRIGDTVEVEEWYGTVEAISMTHTTIKLWDWRRYVLPNTVMLGRSFTNYTLYDAFIWAKVEFFVEPTADLERVRELAVEAGRRSAAWHDSEEPAFWVVALEKDSVKCWVAAWTTSPGDAWTWRSDVSSALLRALRDEGIASNRFKIHRESA